MDNELGSDSLGDLPLEITERILMFLPIRDAIRTSILSRSWRYRWVGLPQLVFYEDDMGFPAVENAIHEDPRLKIFVTQTLFRHQGPIQKFKLRATRMDSCPKTDEWLLLLSRKDVKQLDLEISECWEEVFRLPSCLYSCRNLTRLELSGCEFDPPPPAFKGFLCLRDLLLTSIFVPPGTIESLVANCPLLEYLECTDAGRFELRISAPNLKCVSLNTAHKKLYLCAPLLTKLFVELDLLDFNGYGVEDLQRTHSICHYTEFLGGFPNLETFIGSGTFTKYLSVGIENCHHPLAFHHLEVIKLYVSFDDMNGILLVVRLIMDASNLSYLHVVCYRDRYASKTPHIHFWDSECPQNCTFEKLVTIKMTNFSGSLHEMKFIQFLLASSPVLETLIIETLQTIPQEKLDLIVEWLSPYQASTNAKMLVKYKPNPPLRR